MNDTPAADTLKIKEALDFYEGGKHRRYSLLFAVNGGAFAVAKLIGEGKDVGKLSIDMLSVGMAIFTAVMIWDIWAFGERSRKNAYFGTATNDAPRPDLKLFGAIGKFVLGLIGLLITTGWLLVGFGFSVVVFIPFAVFVFTLLLVVVINDDEKKEISKPDPPNPR